MAKQKTNWIPFAVLGAGALFLLSKTALGDEMFSGGYGSGMSMPSLIDNGIVGTSGGYYPEEDPIRALRYTPTISNEAIMLQAMTKLKGEELRAKEIMPVVQNLSHEATKTAILLSSPNTLKSYTNVIKGTINVSPAIKDSSGMTSTDRNVRASSKYVGSKYTSGGI